MAGDILYSKIRPELRKVCIANFQGICSADMYAIKTKNNLLTEFLLWVLLSSYFSKYAIDTSLRVKMPKINREAMNEFQILLPPTSEQENICKLIQSISSAIKSLIDKQNQEINLLIEYRTTLISETVTGKIDVRENNG